MLTIKFGTKSYTVKAEDAFIINQLRKMNADSKQVAYYVEAAARLAISR